MGEHYENGVYWGAGVTECKCGQTFKIGSPEAERHYGSAPYGVIRCEVHDHYLVYVSATSMVWNIERDGARRYDTEDRANYDIEKNAWIDHKPVLEVVTP